MVIALYVLYGVTRHVGKYNPELGKGWKRCTTYNRNTTVYTVRLYTSKLPISHCFITFDFLKIFYQEVGRNIHPCPQGLLARGPSLRTNKRRPGGNLIGKYEDEFSLVLMVSLATTEWKSAFSFIKNLFARQVFPPYFYVIFRPS